jgi:integrase
MATVIKRPRSNGSTGWQVRIRRRGYVLSRSFSRKAQADAWARKIESKIDAGTYRGEKSATGDMTLAAALERYVRTVSIHKADTSAIIESRRARRLAKDKHLGRLRFERVSSADFARHRDRRLASGHGANDIRLDLALLGHLYVTARREWNMPALVNPVADVGRPKLPAGRARRLESGEEARLLAIADDYGGEIGDIIRFALATGMRRGAISEMEWSSLDLDRRIYKIPVIKDARVVRSHLVPLSKAAIEILRKRKLLCKVNETWVWSLEPASISQAFSRIFRRSGIEGLHFHDLRHEATSRLFEKGLSTMEVAGVTGHKTMQMLKRYTHLRPEDLARRLD